jgi:hypothetical protein
MGFFAMLAAATIPATVPTELPQPIVIHPGETITIRIQDNRAVILDRSPAPPMSPFEAATLRRVQALDVPADAGVQPAIPITRGDIPDEPPKIVPGQVRLTYRLVSGTQPGSEQHSFLVLVNGYPNWFRYRAIMHVRGHVTPTDVCEVRPNLIGNEHWPYAIDELDITAAWLEPPHDRQVRCE